MSLAPQRLGPRERLAVLIPEIGGEEAVSRILLRFYERMASDTMLGFFFAGKNLEVIASKQKEFLLRAAGQKPSYSGRPPAQAHLLLPPILPGHFDRRILLLREILAEEGLTPEQSASWTEFEELFRDAIVTPK